MNWPPDKKEGGPGRPPANKPLRKVTPPGWSTQQKSDGRLPVKERTVLATLLAEWPPQLPPVCAKLLDNAPQSFDDQRHGAVAVAVRELSADGKSVNLVSVEAGVNFPDARAYLARLAGDALSLDLAELEAAEVWKAYQLRRAKTVCAETIEALEANADQAGAVIANARATLDAVAQDAGVATLPALVDAAELVAHPPELPADLVCGMLHKGAKLVLGGSSKTNKTWTLADLALSVSHGEPFWGHKTNAGRVLFVNLEIQPAFFARRLDFVARAKSTSMRGGRLDVLNLRGHCAPFDVVLPRIEAQARTRGYSLIILDPVYKIMAGRDEKGAGDVGEVMAAMERLAVNTGAAVAFVAHYSKGNQAAKDSVDRISGSGVFARDPDTILTMTRHEVDGAFVVEPILRNHPPIAPFVVRWEFPLMRRADDLDPVKLKQPGGRPKLYTVEKILACLKGKKLSSQNWFQEASPKTGISKSRFYTLLDEAKRLPQVKQTPEGLWFYEECPRQ